MPVLVGGTSGRNLTLYWLTCAARPAPLDEWLAEGSFSGDPFPLLELWTGAAGVGEGSQDGWAKTCSKNH